MLIFLFLEEAENNVLLIWYNISSVVRLSHAASFLFLFSLHCFVVVSKETNIAIREVVSVREI